MKFRTKLYIGLIGIAILSALIGISVLYYKYQLLVFKDFKTKVLTAALTASTLVDSNALKQLQKNEDENSPAYQKLRDELLDVIKVNQQGALYISYIYTLMPDPKRPGHLMFGVDADPVPAEAFHIGHPYEDSDEADILEHLYEPWGREEFIEDARGLWFSAYAPVMDKGGKYVGTIGVDLRAEDVYKELRKVAFYSLLGLLTAIIFAFFVAKFLAHFFTASLGSISSSVKKIEEGKLDTIAVASTRDEFHDLAEAINKMTKGLRERERLKLSFSRYVSQHILEKILKSEVLPKFEGERKKVTILFSDIRKFTPLAESLPPEQMVSILNEYFAAMIEVIFSNRGTLDKFIGDGLMVEFGTPLEDNQQEKNAIQTALEMQKALTQLNAKWKVEGKPLLNIGIGIHTGYAVVGNIGSEKRTEFTAIGDTVNVASRLEQTTKLLHVPILISEATYQFAKDQFSFEDLGIIQLSGRIEKTRVYTVKLE